jgi:hypothetical protein
MDADGSFFGFSSTSASCAPVNISRQGLRLSIAMIGFYDRLVWFLNTMPCTIFTHIHVRLTSAFSYFRKRHSIFSAIKVAERLGDRHNVSEVGIHVFRYIRNQWRGAKWSKNSGSSLTPFKFPKAETVCFILSSCCKQF